MFEIWAVWNEIECLNIEEFGATCATDPPFVKIGEKNLEGDHLYCLNAYS